MSEGNSAHVREHGLPADCVIDTRLGIERLLQAIVQAKRPALVASRISPERATVRLLEIDARRARIVFVPLSANPMDTWLNNAREVVFTSDHDGVPIEFTCERPTRTVAGGSEAYSARFPAYIIRLQRRNAYRLPAPAIACTLRDEASHGPDLRPTVLDVSAGGVDLAMPLTAPRLCRDTSYDCTIELPGHGTLWVRLRVVSIFKTADGRRYGCQFTGLSGASELLLQRYILDEQRARRRTWHSPTGPRI
jgi:c-di-GMP-binding flagellar brake protein YcgR